MDCGLFALVPDSGLLNTLKTLTRDVVFNSVCCQGESQREISAFVSQALHDTRKSEAIME